MSERSTSIGKDLEKEGYSKEEEYFHRVNQALIEKRRRELDERRAEQKSNGSKSVHWMKCPKCGNQMQEILFSGIYADQCTGCHGIYFDQGEFETMMEAKMPKNFLKTLFKKIGMKVTQFDTDWRP